MKFSFTYVTHMYSRLPPPPTWEPYHLLNAEFIYQAGPKFFDTVHMSKVTFTVTRKLNGYFEESYQFWSVEIQKIRQAWSLFTLGSYVKGRFLKMVAKNVVRVTASNIIFSGRARYDMLKWPYTEEDRFYSSVNCPPFISVTEYS
jgi:hypothetical protein